MRYTKVISFFFFIFKKIFCKEFVIIKIYDDDDDDDKISSEQELGDMIEYTKHIKICLRLQNK
jgi:hypothetical protein